MAGKSPPPSKPFGSARRSVIYAARPTSGREQEGLGVRFHFPPRHASSHIFAAALQRRLHVVCALAQTADFARDAGDAEEMDHAACNRFFRTLLGPTRHPVCMRSQVSLCARTRIVTFCLRYCSSIAQVVPTSQFERHFERAAYSFSTSALVL